MAVFGHIYTYNRGHTVYGNFVKIWYKISIRTIFQHIFRHFKSPGLLPGLFCYLFSLGFTKIKSLLAT